MRRLVLAAAMLLATTAAAGARPGAGTSDVLKALDHTKRAIALERAALRFVNHRPWEPTLATNRLEASSDELATALHFLGTNDPTGMFQSLAGARVDDASAISEIRKGDPARAATKIEDGLESKQRALREYDRARKGGGRTKTFGCRATIGESQAYPGESELAVAGCSKGATALTFVLDPHAVVKSMSKVAVVSSAIDGGLAVSSCINPAPNQIRCGGYPTFMPPGAKALVDFLPHAKPGDTGTVTIGLAGGGSVTLGFTQK